MGRARCHAERGTLNRTLVRFEMRVEDAPNFFDRFRLVLTGDSLRFMGLDQAVPGE